MAARTEMAGGESRPRPFRLGAVGRALSFRNASALWVFVVIFVVFSIWVPDTFLTWTTWRTLIDAEAIPAIVAVGLVLPLAAGAFDLAIGSELGFSTVFIAWLMAKQGLPVVPAIIVAIIGGGLIGVISGLLVVRARIDSFIATLGVSSILIAGVSWVSGGNQILGLSSGYTKLGGNQILGLTLPVYFMLVIALIVFYVLERTTIGRRIYATGGNLEAARLAGVRVSMVIVGSLVACGVLAAIGGVLLAADLEVGDPTVGPGYLLPAFTAAFLGSTQFRGGRFNVWGTVVATYVLATGVKGLQLGGAPTWIPDLFNGVALLIAVGLAKYQGNAARTSAIRRLISRRAESGVQAPAPSSAPR
jgi:ribose transport system permease protein